jgi:hypothetical protein
MEILEGAWDCSQCREIGIRGSLRNCPKCGDPRNPLLDPAEAPYLPEGAPVITDPGEIAAALAGPDWNCGHCGQGNPGNVRVCAGCGAALDYKADVQPVNTYVSGADARGVQLSDPAQADADRVDLVLRGTDPLLELDTTAPLEMPGRTYDGSALPARGNHTTWRTDTGGSDGIDVRTSRAGIRGRLTSGRNLVLALGALAAGGLGTGGYVAYDAFVATHDVTLQVAATSWQRQIDVQQLNTHTESDWVVPAGGRIVSSTQAIRSYRTVVVGYETRTRQVSSQVESGSHEVSTPCGTTKRSLGNGRYSSSTRYCEESVTDYRTVYHTQTYQVPDTRQVPAYATRYTYLIDRWDFDHVATAKGHARPYWPNPDVRGRQRAGTRTASYTVTLVDTGHQGRVFTETVSEGTWSGTHVGETFHAQETSSGSLRGINWSTGKA